MSLPTLPPATIRAASLHVASRATSPDDLRHLLGVLGLPGGRTEREVTTLACGHPSTEGVRLVAQKGTPCRACKRENHRRASRQGAATKAARRAQATSTRLHPVVATPPVTPPAPKVRQRSARDREDAAASVEAERVRRAADMAAMREEAERVAELAAQQWGDTPATARINLHVLNMAVDSVRDTVAS